ncbi:uncharacterized protein LOC132271234 [Cornus florida]|uniref:uncharacterized protein LOC132271234 n=1 Tax=Cornus florida TaxID=4283 RepID=UPI0028A23135|nr:uncharacterized protein LOC132271234 [Cornus florida]
MLLDFRYNTNAIEGAKNGMNVFSAASRHNSASAKRSDCVLVQTGFSSHDVLILSGHIGQLLSLYAALRQKFSCEGYWLDCPIAVSARKLIVQFCLDRNNISIWHNCFLHSALVFSRKIPQTYDGIKVSTYPLLITHLCNDNKDSITLSLYICVCECVTGCLQVLLIPSQN